MDASSILYLCLSCAELSIFLGMLTFFLITCIIGGIGYNLICFLPLVQIFELATNSWLKYLPTAGPLSGILRLPSLRD